jgi:hypothetical protein
MRTTPLQKALDQLRAPDALLVLQHKTNGKAEYQIWPSGGRVPDAVAQELLGRNDVQPFDLGLIEGCPQSWKLGGNWRRWQR